MDRDIPQGVLEISGTIAFAHHSCISSKMMKFIKIFTGQDIVPFRVHTQGRQVKIENSDHCSVGEGMIHLRAQMGGRLIQYNAWIRLCPLDDTGV